MKWFPRSLCVVGLVLVAAACFAGPFDGRPVLLETGGAATTTAAVRTEGVEEFVRIGSYNIAHARGNGENNNLITEMANKKNLDGIAAMLKDRKIDICGLVEISKGDLRAKFRDQPKYIANNIGSYHHVYGENLRIGLGLIATQGNAFVSRFPILWSENHKLYRSDKKNEQRSCLEALLDLGGGHKLRVMVAHLSLKKDESEKQMAEIWDLVLKSKEPVLLMGDFNSRPASDGIKWLSARMKDTTANVNTTFLQKPNVKIDYIFSYGSIRCGTAFVDGFKQGYSDHGCLINEFHIKYPH